MKFKSCYFELRSCFAAMALEALIVWPGALQAQHVHVNAGATDITQDAPLYFANGFTYNTNAGYDVYLTFTNAGSFSNLYQGGGVSFTALASTLDNGGPAFGHAADGAFLKLQFVSMRGPAEGVFGVWMRDAANPAISSPLFTLPVGTTNGANFIELSESDGSPGTDPYGHIHGRTFTATQPGLYTLGCRLLDTSRNGAGGGPLHKPSEIYYFHFQAGLTLSSRAIPPNSLALTFGTAAGKTYYVESASSLPATNWITVAGPFTGNNYLQTTVQHRAFQQLYFRLRSD